MSRCTLLTTLAMIYKTDWFDSGHQTSDDFSWPDKISNAATITD